MRDEDVQVLHVFDPKENAQAYLQSELFNADVVISLSSTLLARNTGSTRIATSH